MQIVEPEIDSWYKTRDSHIEFEVVAMDEDCIEIQYFEGEIEEIEREVWYSMNIYHIAPPEDWSGPYEMEQDELNQEEVIHPEQWDLLSSEEFDDYD